MNHREGKRPRQVYPSVRESSSPALPLRSNDEHEPVAAPVDASLLLELSGCCHRHLVAHHAKKESASTVWCDDEEQIPEGCRVAITSLRQILPKVEAKHTYRAPGQKKGPAARDVAHMCDFYTSVLGGVFCPHAQHLFLLGKGATEILPRVHSLFQTLASRAVIGNTVATAAAPRQEPISATATGAGDAQQHPKPFSATIASTIAQLLSFVPDPVLQHCMLRDLIYLAMDLSVLAQSGLLETSTTGPVEVVLFPETVEKSGLADGTSYAVDVPNIEALLSLQGGTLSVLETFLAWQKKKRLELPPDDGRAAVNDPHSAPTENDFFFSGILAESETIRTLLGALRQVMCTPTQPDRKLRVLSMQSKESAAKLLSILQQDYRRNGVPTLSLLLGAALLVVQATQNYLRLARDHGIVDSDSGSGYSSTLVSLVENLILFSPCVQGASSPKDTEVAIGRGVLPVLLECLEYINVEPLQVDDSGKVLADERALESVVLRTIHALLRKIDGSGSSPSTLMDSLSVVGFSRKAVEKLFQFLDDQILSDSAIRIVSWMIFHSGEQNNRLVDIGKVCDSCLSMREKDSLSLQPDIPASKRRHPSVASDGSNRLHSETSPAKRQKTDHSSGFGLPSMGDESAMSNGFEAGQQNGCVTLCSIDALFGKFLRCAISSVEGLLRTLQGSNLLSITSDRSTDPSRITVLLTTTSNAVTVSSAVRLLLCLVKVTDPNTQLEGEGLFSLFEFLSFVAKPLSELYLSVEAVPKDAVASPSLLRSLLETGVKCGFHAHHLLPSLKAPPVSLENVDPPLYIILESLSRTATGLYRLLESSESIENGLPALPAFMTEAVFNCAIDASFTAQLHNVVSVFGQIIAAVEFGFANSGPSTFLCASSLLDPLTGEIEAQERRLGLLGQRLNTPSGSNVSLQEATLGLLNAEGICKDPVVRLLRWQAVSWLFLSTPAQELRRIMKCDDSFADTKGLDSSAGGTSVKWLIGAAFSDPDDMVRDYASKEIGGVLSASNSTGVLAVVSRDDDWSSLVNGIGLGNARQRDVDDHVYARFFQEVDRLLHEYCRVPQSQLSFTVRISSASRQNDASRSDPTSEKILAFQRSAIRALVSMCERVDVETTCGKVIFEQSLVRIVRLWTGLETGRRLESAGIGYGELSRLSRCAGIREQVREHCMASIMPRLFHDILVPSSGYLHRGVSGSIESMPPEIRERQYRLLLSFIQSFLVVREGPTRALFDYVLDSTFADADEVLESCLPLVIAQLVVEKDYDTLRLTTGFKLFLQSLMRAEEKCGKRRPPSAVRSEAQPDSIVGGPNSIQAKTSSWTRRLEEQTRNLILAPQTVERILPSIFMRAGHSEMVFFIKEVLHNKVTMKDIITSREQLILKGLVWQLGRDPDLLELAMQAIRAAASARNQEPTRMTPSSADDGIPPKDVVASKWISSNFMYLLVNAVQFRWSSRSTAKRVQAVRCLFFMLDFLLPSYSPQYVPQIMATVNAAVGQERDQFESSRERELRLQLRLLAVRALSKFVKLVAKYQWETLGHNLVSLVVSLIPILSEEEEEGRRIEEWQSAKDSSATAVEILEWLTQGDLGKNLAKFFTEIPFLPSSPALDTVRNSLRALGVDFDDLHVIPTQGTQQDSLHRESGSLQSEGGSMSTDARAASWSSRRQGALKNRIEMVCSLLGNENASIRRVVLQHLTALLRANRELFHILVENEGATSMRRYVTIAYPGTSGFSRGTVTEMVDVLLSRCVRESDPAASILLATCFGEVGAIGENRLEETKAPSAAGTDNGDDAFSWRLSKPPWQSRPARYELKLVTKYLVIALKAAPTSGDQHKIAYTIQQLLVLLDISASESTQSRPSATSRSRKDIGNDEIAGSATPKPEMNSWLATKLSDAEVLDVVEPFWFSCFAEYEGFAPKKPPFFRTSSSYYQWVSSWSRFMVQRSYETRKTKWSELFYACRTALRTQAGLGVAEFLLPILVLDRICFGDGPDELAVVQEMRDVLTFDENGTAPDALMAHSERQKSVSALFMIIDTLQFWSEQETEQRHKNSSGAVSESLKERRSNPTPSAGDEWPLDESIMRIDDILQAIPLSLRADAAAKVGMHARALRYLEMAARARVVDSIFHANPGKKGGSDGPPKWSKSRAAGICTACDLNLTKEVLADLNDYETMSSLEEDTFLVDPSARVRDSIRQKEATGDWEGALQDYERAQQIDGLIHRNPLTQRGALRCMLRLGRLDSVLSQVNGIMSPRSSAEDMDISNAIPIAVEASWRLGRWESLAELVDVKGTSSIDSDGSYQVSLGHVMLGLHTKDLESVTSGLKRARGALMEGLSSVARESYSRAYDRIIRLQSLREIEDASHLVCAEDSAMNLGEWAGLDAGCGWDRRLDFVSPSGATTIINTRLALARLRSDSAFEGSLFLNMGKRARKNGLYNIATNAFAQAEAAFDSIGSESRSGLNDFSSTLRMQVAKLRHDTGESSMALRMLGQEDVERMADLDEPSLRLAAVSHVKRTVASTLGSVESKMIDGFVRSVLQSTRWMVEGGLKGGTEIMARFRIIHRLAPGWEKGHFQFAKYVDSVMVSRIMALQRRSSEHYLGTDEDILRNRTIAQDRTCQKHVLLAIKHYAEALSIDTKHVYQALPRLLSLWFDFTSIKKKAGEPEPGQQAFGLASQVRSSQLADAAASLSASQDEANAFMAKKFKQIPAQAFYTAMAQLISRVIHDDKETALVVRGILRRVLTKFPGQAMWPLAWLRQSRDPERLQIGDALFHEAERGLMKGPNQTLFKVLVASKSLFKYFQELAKYPVKDSTVHTINVKSWKGEVDLTEFVPPIQAALSITMPSQENGRSRDLFPRQVPRMRSFNPRVGVMGSKARPKKLKAFVVATDSRDRPRSSDSTLDIGEIHFLVKQEAKGDLRKDARVQDLNNVINRLMASSNESKGTSRNRRRLHLRTFAVTCLSEETGLLEWVPDTESLRSLVCSSYNPQASPFSSKRRGRRLANFGDPMLRNNFEKKCQEMYFINGNLTRAAALFEELCMKPYPPLLFWWFCQKFHDPHAWYEARTRFTLSAAAWSAVGHVIGLGDRHSDNILVDTTTGECVHVDFDCIFDKGLNLPKPEVVPFRLTQNMLDAFGPAGADGIYSGSLQAAMSTLRDNRDTLLSVLEPFLKDPVIDWKRYRSQQKDKKGSTTQDRQTIEAKRSINVIDERLKGIYNLRNPNHHKIRRTDGLSVDQQDDELSHLLPLSVEGQVHKMIAEATNNENLVQLYVGWMPWV